LVNEIILDGILWNTKRLSGYCCKVDKKWALLGYYAESSSNFLPTFWNYWSHLQGSRIQKVQIPDLWRWDWYPVSKCW